METIGSEPLPDVDTGSSCASSSGQVGGRFREVTGPAWRAARARLARVGDDMRIEARSTAYAAERYAREKPWRVAGVAAAIALFAGMVIGARLGAAASRRGHGQ